MSLTLEECSLEKISPLLERFARDVLSQKKPVETVQNDLFYVLIIVLMLENGFLPKANDSVICDDINNFDITYSTHEKLCVGLYKTEFVMSGFEDLSLKVLISPLGALMLVNLIFNNHNAETYSVCLPVSRYVVSPQASTIPLIFRDLKHLSITFKDKVLSAAKSKILTYYGYASASLVGLPDDILIYNILLYLPVASIMNISRSCKRLKAIASNESLWREMLKRDFKDLLSPKASGWREQYKDTYIARREMRNSSVRSFLNFNFDTFSDFEDKDFPLCYYNSLRNVFEN